MEMNRFGQTSDTGPIRKSVLHLKMSHIELNNDLVF